LLIISGFSRTSPAHLFDPSEVSEINDMQPDGTAESTEFDDKSLAWPALELWQSGAMNDGCARISLASCQAIWRNLGQSDMMPSVFQARLNGAKGVWIKSAPSDSIFPEHRQHWIEVNRSQRKFQCHDEDRTPEFDPERWTIEVNTYPRKPMPSILHPSFVPILVDRGVSRDAIAAFMNKILSQEREELFQAIRDPLRLLYWLQRVFMYDYFDVDTPEFAMPKYPLGKIWKLLQCGFEPKKLGLLNQEVSEQIRRYLLNKSRGLKISLPKSTIVIGIADPLKLLQPGEIFLSFSHGFPIGEDRVDHLSGEVLVSRHPAMRRSDIQKVRAVYIPELFYLTDVVIFPSTGAFPLASKLSGGDYDGDGFWVGLLIRSA
jgi:RNA dependent RNA polymerase